MERRPISKVVTVTTVKVNTFTIFSSRSFRLDKGKYLGKYGKFKLELLFGIQINSNCYCNDEFFITITFIHIRITIVTSLAFFHSKSIFIVVNLFCKATIMNTTISPDYFYFTVREVHTIFEIIVGIISYLLNFLVMYLSITTKNTTMKQFSTVILINVFGDLAFNTMNMIVMEVTLYIYTYFNFI